MLGVVLIPWQRWFLIHSLELRPDGKFRFRTVLLQVARQNGKTTLVEVKNLWKLYVLGVRLVVGTAQDLDIAEESWEHALEIIEENDELAELLGTVSKTNGRKFFKLAGGRDEQGDPLPSGRWKIKAANRSAGRGLSGDDVNLDELREHRNWLAWSAISKTTMARPNAQIFAFSNAGDDESVVLNGLRGRGLMTVPPEDVPEAERIAGGLSAEDAARFEAIASDSLALFEWSAPLGCRIDDPLMWRLANPSMGYTITEDAIRDALGTDEEPIFRTEVLCQRVSDMVPRWQVVPAAEWSRCRDASFRGALPALVLDAEFDLSSATVVGAGDRDDDRIQVGVVKHAAGMDWVVPWARRVFADDDPPDGLVVSPKSPAAALIPDLEDAAVPVLEPDEEADAFARFVNGCKPRAEADDEDVDALSWRGDEPGDDPDGAGAWNDQVRHLDQAPLNRAVEVALTRKVGARKLLDRTVPGIAPLVAASLAVAEQVRRRESEVVPMVWWGRSR